MVNAGLIFGISLAMPVVCLLPMDEPGQQRASSGIQIETNAQGVEFKENGHTVLFYQAAPKSLDGRCERAGYVHPLYDLDGNVITEDFPEDHLHQRGVFWAWHQIHVGGQYAGNSWLAEDLIWDVQSTVTTTHADYAQLTASLVWKSRALRNSSGPSVPIAQEIATIRVYRAEDNLRKIDFEIGVTPLVNDLSIGGSPDDKGYGGFSARFKLPPDVKFLSHGGLVEPQRTAVDAGHWVDVQGTFNNSQAQSGIAILCHPSTRGFPQKWILRDRNSMQNPVYPGSQRVRLSKQNPLTLRYRLVLHRGVATNKLVDQWQKEYADESLNER